MNERDVDRAEAVRKIAATLAAAYVRLRFPVTDHRQSTPVGVAMCCLDSLALRCVVAGEKRPQFRRSCS